MQLFSSSFENGGIIPTKYACDGEKINPALAFLDVPAGTKTLALIMEDRDVPRSLRPDRVLDHWVVWNIPGKTKEILDGINPPGVTGLNGRGTLEYIPPCPPDREHGYFFLLYALDDTLQISPTSNKMDLLKAMKGHIIDHAQLMGRYDRKK